MNSHVSLRLIPAIVFLWLSTHPCPAGEPFTLVENGQPQATIVYSLGGSSAAGTLQSWVKEITGATLPRVREQDFDGQGPAVVVGMGSLARAAGIDIQQDGDRGDRYIIRTENTSFGRRLYLVGNDGDNLTGSIYAVYDLMQRLGCGWFGPDPLWQVLPQLNTLQIPSINVEELAAFDHRHIWMVKDRNMQYAWRLGGRAVSHGHALASLVPRDELYADHPDWFGPIQPCVTHPEVIEYVAAKFRSQLTNRRGVQAFSLSPIDGGGFCSCSRCQVIGNISARILYFANSVARELAKTHPNRYLLTFYAYWYTHSPPSPMRRAEPGVCVMQVNEGDHCQPWDKMPEPPEIAGKSRNNTREVTAFAGWKQTAATMAIYEWWIPGTNNPNWRSVPWYSGETALRNLRYWKKHGVRYLTYETGYENGSGFPIRWPLYYVGARGLWNPQITAEQVMTEACQKLYGPAGPRMLRYYQALEYAVAHVGQGISGGNWHLPGTYQVYTPQDEVRATELLQAAAAATDDPTISQRIAQERDIWEAAKAIMAQYR